MGSISDDPMDDIEDTAEDVPHTIHICMRLLPDDYQKVGHGLPRTGELPNLYEIASVSVYDSESFGVFWPTSTLPTSQRPYTVLDKINLGEYSNKRVEYNWLARLLHDMVKYIPVIARYFKNWGSAK